MATPDQRMSPVNNTAWINKPEQDWPALPLGEWESTYKTLHLWTQVVGKIRMELSPFQNHWWHVPLYVSTRGLRTSPVPYRGRAFEIEFDFVHHELEIRTSDGFERISPLAPKSVAVFWKEVFSTLHEAGIDAQINPKSQEMPEPVDLDRDETDRSYDPEYANRFWRILKSTEIVFQEFRGRYNGKVSPVHFFWGSFDLACTRFSGRSCPPRKGAISSEAYSSECSSVGWWPGSGEVAGPAFYAYNAPAPAGYEDQKVGPAGAFYHKSFREYILMYDDVRRASSPRDAILEFAQSTYEAGANLGKWDRAALERAGRAS
jgi:Family of unknown function (DUF5996)